MEPSGANNPHDALFHAAFSTTARATDLLRHLLPEEIAVQVDWRTLRVIEGTFIDAALRKRFTDLLFSANLRGRRTALYVLIEHRSFGDRLVALSLAEYTTRILRHLAAEIPGELLPPVVPLVIQHGPGARGPRSLRELIDLSGLPESLIRAHLDLSFLLRDLTAMAVEEIVAWKARADTRLALLHLKKVPYEPSTSRLLLSWADLYREVTEDPGAAHLLDQLVSYVAEHASEDRATILAAYDTIHPMTKELFMPLAEKWRQEGRQEGHEITLRSTLRIIAEERFGPLSEAVVARIETVAVEELERLTRRIVHVKSPDELFE